MHPNPALVRLLWIVVILLAFIGLAVATRRAVVLFDRGAPTAPNNPAAALDAHFADHRSLTLAHILPAALFMLLGPLQFVRRIRSNYPRFHRWSGRIFLAASAIVGVSGLTMAFGKTVGGLDEKAAITLFGTFFLIALSRALWHAMHREFAQHREWMIRGYATGLAVAAIRPIMGAFFAAALLRGRTPEPQPVFRRRLLDRLHSRTYRRGTLDQLYPAVCHRPVGRLCRQILQQSFVGSVPTSKFVP